MKETSEYPYMMVKPYTAQHLEALADSISDNGLNIRNIFSTDKWAEVARKIYQKNIDRDGYQFKIGLEGHIKLVNHFFGNNGLVLFVEGRGKKKVGLENTLNLIQSVKKEFRESMPAGENLKDIVVMMNLSEVEIGSDTPSFQSGVIGMRNDDLSFKEVSPHRGKWDYFYFKYVHVPDDLIGLAEEISILHKMGVLDKKNELTFDDFTFMAKLKTLIPPKSFR